MDKVYERLMCAGGGHLWWVVSKHDLGVGHIAVRCFVCGVRGERDPHTHLVIIDRVPER
jgi:hypothetical protein